MNQLQWRLTVAEWSGQPGHEHRVFVPAGQPCDVLCNEAADPTSVCSEVPLYDNVCSPTALVDLVVTVKNDAPTSPAKGYAAALVAAGAIAALAL